MAIRLSGLVSNMDTDAIIKELMSAQNTKKTKIENKITKLEWKQDTWKSFNTKIYSLYTGTLSKMRMQGSYATKKATTTNENALTVTATSNAASGAHKVGISKLASAQYMTSGKVSLAQDATATSINSKTTLKDLGMEVGTKITITQGSNSSHPKVLEVKETTTIADFVSTCNSAGLNASYDEIQGRFFISSKGSGKENAFKIESDKNNLDKLGLSETGSNAMTYVEAEDAEFTLNGASMTSSSNTITVNGLTLQLKEVTENDLTVSVTNDTDATYDLVKDFIKEYNTLLEELNTAYYAGTAKGYEPLTDEQKEEMTDDEIEKWEKKIKDSLLRRDDKLGGLLSSMKSALSGSVAVNGKSYSLASFGISSIEYTEKGKLHIDGNSEDELAADREDKLKAAIEDDPDTVMKVLSSICGELYSTMQDKMKGTTLNSALTFYNDKEMKSTLDKYEKDLKKMESKLKDIEDRYYAQFSAMETAMSKLNSQSNALASMIGGNS